MYIYDIVPLAAIPRPNPQVLSYYYPRKLARFSLVQIPVGKRLYPGVAIAIRQVQDLKAVLRKAYFQVKKVEAVIYAKPILFEWQFTLATWIADYYWASLGLMIKKFVPRYIYQHPATSIQPARIKRGRQVLDLFPDTSFFQKVEILKDFIAISSRLSAKQEFQIFKKVISGKINFIAGTKKALFLPYTKLREIRIFEEADDSHKSWEQHPKYNAVMVARKLARLHSARVIYHSTLPSLYNYYRKFPFQSYDIQCRKDIECRIIDLTKEKLQRPFSEELQKVLRGCYTAGKQAVLYVNRRGEGRFLLCRDCGFVPKCLKCDLSLVFHLTKKSEEKRRLLCHHCGYEEAPPSFCSQCSSHEVRSYGFGTQRVEAELGVLFPKAKVFRLDSDSAVNEKAKTEIMEKFSVAGNFLVTTSMLFQNVIKPVALVGALNPDSEMNIPDFTQQEKLFFNLWRLKSWSKKSFYIQTYNPKSPVFEHLVKGDWQGFYKEELKVRKALNYPPFSSIIKLTYSHKNEAKARKEAEILQKKLHQQARSYQLEAKSYQFLGPAPAFLPKLKGEYRYNILLKIKPQASSLKPHLLSIVPSSWDIDVDPVDSL